MLQYSYPAAIIQNNKHAATICRRRRVGHCPHEVDPHQAHCVLWPVCEIRAAASSSYLAGHSHLTNFEWKLRYIHVTLPGSLMTRVIAGKHNH